MTKQKTKPRLAPFSVRFTPEERAKVEAQAGNMPLGSYIKTVVLMDNAPRYRARRKPPVKDHVLLAQVLACLGSSRLANNLNQLAKATHIGSFYFDDETKRSILSASDDVRAMRIMLMRALGQKVSEPVPGESVAQTFLRVAAEREQ